MSRKRTRVFPTLFESLRTFFGTKLKTHTYFYVSSIEIDINEERKVFLTKYIICKSCTRTRMHKVHKDNQKLIQGHFGLYTQLKIKSANTGACTVHSSLRKMY